MSLNPIRTKQENVVVFLVLGEHVEYYFQAHFSLVSFMAKHPDCQYLVITDHPTYFDVLDQHQNIHIQEVKAPKLKEWFGPHQYFFRSKIKCLQLASELFPDSNLVLIDSDTALVNRFDTHFGLLSDSKGCVFHCSEGPMSKRRGKTSKAIWAHLKNKVYFDIPVPDTYCLMNSGVLGFPNQGIQKFLQNALNINDQLLDEKMPGFTHEQIAFNIAAIGEYKELLTCESDLLHYWGNKEGWLDAIKDFFLKCSFEKLDPIKTFDAAFPKMLEKLPIIKQKKTAARRIHKVADKISLKKEIFFGK